VLSRHFDHLSLQLEHRRENYYCLISLPNVIEQNRHKSFGFSSIPKYYPFSLVRESKLIQEQDIRIKKKCDHLNFSRDIIAIGGSEAVNLWRIPEIFSTEQDDEREMFHDFLRTQSTTRHHEIEQT
jgi:hypothetical protein